MENKPPSNPTPSMSPAPIHLISPPPEDDLQPIHKRKRPSTATTQQTTPNPKPRKQLYLRNPNAPDYRKSATPVPYEPPTQHFESPREIFITPSPTKATRRRRTLRIKTEPPPDLDLSAPMPPPSPTDDPLLLSEPQTRMLLDSSLPPSSPPPPSPLSDDGDDDEHVHPLDFTSYRPANLSTSPPMDLSYDGPIPAFTLPPAEKVPLGEDLPADDLSSPQQTTTLEEGEGEYTGRFRQLVIPTKPDPPDARTKERMELWGRPVSPYPYELDRSQTLPPPELPAPSSPLVRDLSLLGLPSRAFSSPTKPNRRRETASFARAKALFGVRSSSPPPVVDDDVPAEEEGVEKDADVAADVDPFNFSSLSLHAPQPRLPSPQPQPLPSTSLPTTSHPEPEEPEEQEPTASPEPEPEIAQEVDGSEDESDPDDDDPSLIKITSSDPRAAARAAAILKQHDYDCYARLLLRRRSKPKTKHQTVDDLRRKTISSSSTSGISKRPRVPRKSVGVLDELVDEASFTLENANTSTPVKTTKTPKRPPATGTSDWNKDHWRFLDGCFTDVRLLDAEGNMKPVDQVDLGEVVDRFIDLIGGEEGEVGWSRDELLGRARAIRKKQARGQVGVPATPLTVPARPVTDVWRFDTPEFTPLPLSKLKYAPKDKDWVLPSPAPFKPSVLQAPRYGHLLDEARKVHSSGSSSLETTPQEPEEQEGEGEEQEDVPEEEEWEDELEVSRSLSLEPDSDNDSDQEAHPESRRTTLGGKLQGLLFSYLPTLSSKPQPKPKPSARPVLPPPPPARPRQINTPARPVPVPTKVPKGKDDLNHVEIPKPKARVRERPRRLKELRPVSVPEKEQEQVKVVVKEVKRKSSVKDLVKSFEEREKAGEKGKVPAWKP
ncbi:hypothetical protein VNI00_017867 [Paramarasmius palmivorus]|uniref:Uncharacterized protein n=1 Tax=Paramarasmius palmivorus TaxID=297713 RepID=A0AAW0B2B2_9AGAR